MENSNSSGKKELSAEKTTFPQAEISYESGRRVSFDQVKVSEKDAQSENKVNQSKINY